MRLSQLITEDRILPSLQSATKASVLDELSTFLASDLSDTMTSQKIFTTLWDREQLVTTAIGKGIAIPHARMAGITAPTAILGRSKTGIDFSAMDGAAVHLIMVLISPIDAKELHLKALSSVARLLRHRSACYRLQKAVNQKELFKILIEEDGKQRSAGEILWG